jgi:hypothetical protein
VQFNEQCFIHHLKMYMSGIGINLISMSIVHSNNSDAP